MTGAVLGSAAVLAVVLAAVWWRLGRMGALVAGLGQTDLAGPVRQEVAQLRVELGQRLDGWVQQVGGAAMEERRETRMVVEALHTKMEWFANTVGSGLSELRGGIDGTVGQLRGEVVAQLSGVRRDVTEQLGAARQETAGALHAVREQDQAANRDSRQALETALAGFGGALDARMRELGERAQADSTALGARMDELVKRTGAGLELLRQGIDGQLAAMRASSEARLEEMRKTVAEKLEGTLEKRLGDSFRLVSERLEQVHKGLGEMQTLASGVGDLKRVLGNVKTRGTWGEVQLGAILEQVMAPGQYEANVATRPGGGARVEYAICLPGPDDATVYLPIDAKFPQEDHLRLIEAQEAGDAGACEAAGRALEARVRACAREIAEKYVAPPHTTDYAILFLATEGLYAEVMRRAGLVEALQREHRIMVAGPSVLAALLNSLQLGFRTLAIEKRSREVWSVLGAVKTEFGKFGEVLDRVRKKLDEASGVIDKAGVRKRAVERKLRDVEELPAHEARALLADAEPIELDDDLADELVGAGVG
jgi:DNA recombination protein RmuC